MSYTLSDFDYELPGHLIAKQPARPRDNSRLLVYDRRTGIITDDHFYNLDRHLPRQTTLVVNNSQVEKCRLLFDRGSKEIFVLKTVNDRTVEAIVRPGKKFKEGKTVELAEGITVVVTRAREDGIRTVELNRPLGDPVYDPYRATPFPPYIEQDESLAADYQTVFARDPGSKAAPTAGLHFTGRLIEKLKKRGFGWQEITLHVGLGTFAPVKVKQIDEHKMHSEWYRIGEYTATALNRASHKTAVGTTSVRVMESAVNSKGEFRACSGETSIFIKPDYRFKSVDSIITNFHLPGSTLLMLVSAYVGLEEMLRVYEHAIEREYRFYSFGDGMLLL